LYRPQAKSEPDIQIITYQPDTPGIAQWSQDPATPGDAPGAGTGGAH
jgi:hypothetical protein